MQSLFFKQRRFPMNETVLFARSGAVARIVLNNPQRHNSLGEAELLQLQEYVARVAADEACRVLVITGRGDRTFCAGAALNQLGAGQISGELFEATTNGIAALKIPSICALNGSVYGGGVELALACDFRVGIENTVLRVPAAGIGLCYPISGINRFVECLGVSISKRILLAAEEFDATCMREIGFLDYLVSAQQLEAKTSDLAASMVGLAPLAVRAMKQIINDAAAGQLDRVAALALAQQCAISDDLQEGFAAQREKRPPQFSGR
ncbi:MAG: enoyl-CoA hydratase/carnithine racemase [Halieaceae bacterium]|jgi:enoyl-CoA hydratase/carnithine racemase